MARLRRLPTTDRPAAKLDASLAIVNVVLLLIFFFIASGSMLSSRGTQISLPETAELPLDMLPEPLLIISEDGTMVLGDVPIPPGGLAEATLDYPILHILAERDAPARRVMEILDDENLIAVELRLVTIHRDEDEGT